MYERASVAARVPAVVRAPRGCHAARNPRAVCTAGVFNSAAGLIAAESSIKDLMRRTTYTRRSCTMSCYVGGMDFHVHPNSKESLESLGGAGSPR
jgi:hypothetical protein